jgi:hypothetical protein
MTNVSGMQKGRFWYTLCHVVKLLTHICTSELFKTLHQLAERVKPHKNVTEILLQHDNALTHTTLKTQEAITKLG